MPIQRTPSNDTLNHLKMGSHVFETVSSFTYLGSCVNNKNDIVSEILNRISLANKAYFGLRTFLKSCFLTRKTKFLVYKTLIRPVLTYGSETWPLTKNIENRITIFERRVLRSILGGVRENDFWRRRTNSEIYEIFKEPDVIKTIKINRMKWAAHIIRMNEENPVRRVFSAKPHTTRKRGRPKQRWIDSVETDFSIIRVKNWKTQAKNRQSWRNLLQKALAHPGLSSQI